MKIDILDYIGKINDGALVLISIIYQGEYYEGTFYYNKNNIVALTVEKKLEDLIGCTIEQFQDYNEIMISLIKRVVPIEEIITRLDVIDINKYSADAIDKEIVYIDSEENVSIIATQSEI